MPRRVPPPIADLFARDHAPTAEARAAEGGIEAGAESGEQGSVGERTSIEAVAKRQADLRAAGIASATAFWKKLGRTWP